MLATLPACTKQMGQVPLLSREEEVEISKRIEVAEIAAPSEYMFH